MATRLIIDGNAVYEIDEDCQEYQKRKNGMRNRGRGWECSAMQKEDLRASRKGISE